VTVLLDLQMGVIKDVRNSVGADGEVAALWVTHRLEELKYTDGAIYMEDGQIISQGNVSTISIFIKKKQAKYFGNFEL
jgi:ABC-type transport system involved in cytochrome bd biosynthesis fused ATPase/permease subunit